MLGAGGLEMRALSPTQSWLHTSEGGGNWGLRGLCGVECRVVVPGKGRGRALEMLHESHPGGEDEDTR